MALKKQRRSRSRQHACQQGIATSGGYSRRQGGLENRAGLARIAENHCPWAIGLDHRYSGITNGEREFYGQLVAPRPANAVGAKESRGRHV